MHILDAVVEGRPNSEDETRLGLAWKNAQVTYLASLDWKSRYILDAYTRNSSYINRFMSTGHVVYSPIELYGVYSSVAPQFHDLIFSPMPYLEDFGHIPLSEEVFTTQFQHIQHQDISAMINEAFRRATILLNEVIRNAPRVPFDLLAFRGINTQLQRQSRGNFKGFVSVSKELSIALQFLDVVGNLLVVTISKDTPCISFFNEDEGEVLLAANTYFDVQEFNGLLYKGIQPLFSEIGEKIAERGGKINFIKTSALDDEEAQRRDAYIQRRKALYEAGLAQERERLMKKLRGGKKDMERRSRIIDQLESILPTSFYNKLKAQF